LLLVLLGLLLGQFVLILLRPVGVVIDKHHARSHNRFDIGGVIHLRTQTSLAKATTAIPAHATCTIRAAQLQRDHADFIPTTSGRTLNPSVEPAVMQQPSL
jgi:hypothetical protein